MDNDNLLFAPKSTKIVTGKMLNKSGCPFCNHKGSSSSTRAFLQEELPEALQSCGYVYIHVCGDCRKRSIVVESLPSTEQRESLRELVAKHYGGVGDDRLMYVAMLR